MIIHNSTKGTLLGIHISLAANFWQRLRGLLGTTTLAVGHGLVIKPCNSIHTWGMAYAIDVLFVDSNNRIIKIVTNLPPGKLARAAGSCYVIELPEDAIQHTLCAVGDILKFT